MAPETPQDRADTDATPDGTPDALAREVHALRQELAYLRQHRMFVIYQSVPRVLLLRLASGMAMGLGTVIGATVLLSLIIWGLSQIEFIPIIGDWAVRIAGEIQALTGSAE